MVLYFQFDKNVKNIEF